MQRTNHVGLRLKGHRLRQNRGHATQAGVSSIPRARTSCSPSPRAPQIKSPSSPGAHITHQRCVATFCGACALPQLAHAGGIGAVRVLLLQPGCEDSPGLLQPKEDDVPKHRIFNNFFWTTIKMSYNGFIWLESEQDKYIKHCLTHPSCTMQTPQPQPCRHEATQHPGELCPCHGLTAASITHPEQSSLWQKHTQSKNL